MKKLSFLFFCSLISFAAIAQPKEIDNSLPVPGKKLQVVETACGQCQLGLPGKSCDLAVRIDGKSYFVDGSSIDSHGDAHAANGFCNTIRKATVQGELVNNRFKVNYFKLLPQADKKQSTRAKQ